MLPADGKLKTVQGYAIEVFLSWIKWAVMSGILPKPRFLTKGVLESDAGMAAGGILDPLKKEF